MSDTIIIDTDLAPTVFDSDGGDTFIDTGENTLDAQAAAAAALADRVLAQTAANVAQGMANFRATFAEAIAAFAVGAYFTSTESGTIRMYQRTAGAPYYVDQGDAAAPISQTTVNSLALVNLRAYGNVTPAATAAASLATAFAAQGRGGSVLTTTATDVGTAAVANPGVEVVGVAPIYYNAADTQGNQVQNKAGRRIADGKFGRDEMFVFLNKIQLFTTCTVALVGDSNMSGYAGTELQAILSRIPGVTITNYAVSGSTVDNWINNTGTVNGTGFHLAAVVAAAPTFIIIGYGGTNEPYYSRTLAQYDTDLDSALTTIRASLARRVCSVLLLSAATQDDGAGSRDELFVHQARFSQVRVALKHGCAWFDKLALAPNASVDFGTGTNQNTWLDSARVHTQNGLSTLTAGAIADFIIPRGFAARAVLGETPTVLSAVIAPLETDAITKYPRGGTLTQRATGGTWPLDGFVTTTAVFEGVAGGFQVHWAYSLDKRLKRHWNNSTWSAWQADGITSLPGNAVLATAITGYLIGFSGQRAIPADGWPLDGFVQTYREPVTGNYGYQEITTYSGVAVPQQRRIYATAGWSEWYDIFPTIQTVASAATVIPTFSNDQVNVTALAAAMNLANPTGTAVDGTNLVVRIKDNGTARALTYGTQYRAIGVTLPATTAISKTVYLRMTWNVADTKFDVWSVAQEA